MIQMFYATNPASTTLGSVTLLPRSSREFGCFWKKFFDLTLQQNRRQSENERGRKVEGRGRERKTDRSGPDSFENCRETLKEVDP